MSVHEKQSNKTDTASKISFGKKNQISLLPERRRCKVRISRAVEDAKGMNNETEHVFPIFANFTWQRILH